MSVLQKKTEIKKEKTTYVKSRIHVSWQRKVFNVFNIVFLTFISVLCLLPLLHILALSFSSPFAASSGKVGIIPVDFTLESYKYVVQNTRFWNSFGVTLKRLFIGVPLTLIIIFITDLIV